MKLTLLICLTALCVAGCSSKKVVVYDERPAATVVRTPVVVTEPAGAAVRVYEPSYRYYDYNYRYSRPMHPQKLGEYHQNWVR